MTKIPSLIRGSAWALVALACLAASPPAWAQEVADRAKFDEVVGQAVAEGRPVRAIVRFRDQAARTRGAATVALRGGRVRRALNTVGGLTADIDAATADALAADAGTLAISVDAPVQASATTTRRSVRSSGTKNARERFNRSGRGIAVAIIDSGVSPHHDLPAARILKFVDFVNGRTTPYDDFGHGTHVAGIVAGTGAASLHLEDPYLGAAPEVDIVALKVLDGNGGGSTSDVIAALEWVGVNHIAYNIRVVNLSLGHPVFEPAARDPMVEAAEALVRLGIVVVASAGNMGLDPVTGLPANGGITSPANGPSIIAVGAIDNKDTHERGDDTVPNYSSRGPTRFDLLVKPDLVASGHRVVSLSAPGSHLFDGFRDLHVTAGSESVAQYMMLSGTSMAAPVVSGTAALMLDASPSMTAGAVRAVLEFTAEHLANANLLTQGAGSLNALGAVRLAGLIKPKVDVGNIWLKSHNSLPQSYDDLLGGGPTAWGKHVIWGDRVLLGDSAYLHMAAWDDNIVWGQDLDNIVWGECEGDACDNIVWGQCNGEGCDDIVWGQCDGNECDNIVWGQNELDNIVWGQCDSADCDNIVWGQDGDNIVWGQADNIVWGQNGTLLGYWAANTIWGFWANVVDWTQVTRQNEDNIVWGQDWLDNIVWGQGSLDNIVWGQSILTEGAR